MTVLKPPSTIFTSSSLYHTPVTKPRNFGFLYLLPSNSLFLPNKSTRIVSFSYTGNPRNTRYRRIEEELVEEEEGERKVHCEVDVISWRERRIKATVLVYADIESVWNALTDYERLADFIPNLISSGRIPCPYPGRIWLEQRGLQRALYWHIEARVVLDLQEFVNSADARELHFSMVDGDFKKFEGKWMVKSGRRNWLMESAHNTSLVDGLTVEIVSLREREAKLNREVGVLRARIKERDRQVHRANEALLRAHEEMVIAVEGKSRWQEEKVVLERRASVLETSVGLVIVDLLAIQTGRGTTQGC